MVCGLAYGMMTATGMPRLAAAKMESHVPERANEGDAGRAMSKDACLTSESVRERRCWGAGDVAWKMRMGIEMSRARAATVWSAPVGQQPVARDTEPEATAGPRAAMTEWIAADW